MIQFLYPFQDGWFGNCQMQECPLGDAWFDEPTATNVAHSPGNNKNTLYQPSVHVTPYLLGSITACPCTSHVIENFIGSLPAQWLVPTWAPATTQQGSAFATKALRVRLVSACPVRLTMPGWSAQDTGSACP